MGMAMNHHCYELEVFGLNVSCDEAPYWWV